MVCIVGTLTESYGHQVNMVRMYLYYGESLPTSLDLPNNPESILVTIRNLPDNNPKPSP